MLVVVFAGGDPVDHRARSAVPPGAVIVAADSGLHAVLDLGLRADVVVGDMDSVDEERLSVAIAAGARVERHPVDKDFTDLELALQVAQQLGATEVLVMGGAGGRLDHFLANQLLLASDAYAQLRIEAITGDARTTVVRDRAELRGKPGSLVTLLAIGGPAYGVQTTGLRFPLHGETLVSGSTRGVSNEMEEPIASVSCTAGVLLAVQPFGGER
jgi:thiamine pyrophosphokinase